MRRSINFVKKHVTLDKTQTVSLLNQGCYQELGAKEFPPAIINVSPAYFHGKIEEK